MRIHISSKVSIFFVAFTCIIAVRTVAGQQTSPSAEQRRLAQALDEIDASLKASGPATRPGCIYAASKEGRLLFSRTYGTADLEQDIPISAGSVFDVSSISKQFTAASILLLAQDGKLKLEDDIRKYLPEMPDYGTPITIRHLLNHTSGLREGTDLELLRGAPSHYLSNDHILRILARQRDLNHAPGARWSYVNSGYILLAIIVGRVSESSLADFSRERLFKPLGMNATQWQDNYARVVKHRVTGYKKVPAKAGGMVYVRALPLVHTVYGNGGLLSTAADLFTWNEALTDGRLGSFVTAELRRKTVLKDGRTIDYGAGLDVDTYRGQEWIAHGGNHPGFWGTLERFLPSRLSIVVLCNSTDIAPRQIARRIADAVLAGALPTPEPAKAGGVVTLTPEQLRDRTGLFVIEQTGYPVVITTDKGKLVVDGEAAETVSENRFLSPSYLGELVFKSPDLAERITQTYPDGLQTLRRIDNAIPAESRLPAFTGTYTSDEVQGSYKVVVEQGALVLKNVGRDGRPIGYSDPLVPIGGDLFKSPFALVRFNRGADGRVDAFDFTTERVRALRFQRASP
jgi:CubicO group peptidase (beta-lactamase class C family)